MSCLKPTEFEKFSQLQSSKTSKLTTSSGTVPDGKTTTNQGSSHRSINLESLNSEKEEK